MRSSWVNRVAGWVAGMTWFGSDSSFRLILQQLPRDHQPLDLAGAFADGAELHVTIKFFRGIVFDEP